MHTPRHPCRDSSANRPSACFASSKKGTQAVTRLSARDTRNAGTGRDAQFHHGIHVRAEPFLSPCTCPKFGDTGQGRCDSVCRGLTDIMLAGPATNSRRLDYRHMWFDAAVNQRVSRSVHSAVLPPRASYTLVVSCRGLVMHSCKDTP